MGPRGPLGGPRSILEDAGTFGPIAHVDRSCGPKLVATPAHRARPGHSTPAFPYVRTGGYTLIDVAAQYAIANDFDVVFGLKTSLTRTTNWRGGSRSRGARSTSRPELASDSWRGANRR
jgi:hypothetical protein